MKFLGLLRIRAIMVLPAFLFAAFILGIADALQFPTLSRFLSEEIHISPFLIGIFFSISATGDIVLSFLLALYSDKRGKRRNIIAFCCCMGIIDSVVFAYSRHYGILLFSIVIFSSLAIAGVPQIFALAREYAIKTKRNIVTFNAFLRAQISLAWVIGPPLSFTLVIHYGFTVMYLTAAVMFLFVLIIVMSFFPVMHRHEVKRVETHGYSENILKNPSVILLFVATIFMWTANMMYIIDMPLYVDDELKLTPGLPGHLMGIAAAIEIPIMLIAGLLVPRIGKKRLFCSAIISGVIFYLGIILFKSEIMLICLQLFNGIFIGVVASIGILYFQELMPNRAGVASTLFNNSVSCSTILAGLIQGSISEFFHHHTVYLISLALVLVSFLISLKIRSV